MRTALLNALGRAHLSRRTVASVLGISAATLHGRERRGTALHPAEAEELRRYIASTVKTLEGVKEELL